MLSNNLKLINYLKEIEIEDNNSNYFIRLSNVDYDERHHIGAYIDKKTNEVEFALLDTCDCYEDIMVINMEELNRLQEIISELMGN